MFERLLGITVRSSRISTRIGVLGFLGAYFASKETQGRGGLHGHSSLWEEGTPSALRRQEMFKNVAFRSRVTHFLEKTMCAYLKEVTIGTFNIAKNIPKVNPPFARPPDPYKPGYDSKVVTHLQQIVINSQIHVCRKGACLVLDRHGRGTCKRRASFALSDQTVVNDDGTYLLRRTIPTLNKFNPTISTSLMCNKRCSTYHKRIIDKRYQLVLVRIYGQGTRTDV